ncbi:Transcription regulator, mannitol operon [Carnobacterium maltaromaticum]|uniref:BglG family transcription antiterminator n=1 Tax=Carnobacterium maltaromaticum TaxID=2751 RepID=UPI00191BA8AF|nr:PRD domain-containing protein [Carnobacterium maltaromaticum]CAD5898351.1 Transcription regulator, mannitol operon [Carnobacterium maltaromaticum]
MYFSAREKRIVEILLHNPLGVQIDYLCEEFKVSKRTIYRELSSLEGTLAQYQMKLIKEKGAGYKLIGNEVLLAELKMKLSKIKNEFDPKQRQSAITCLLLTTDEEMKMEAMALDFGVSIGTIQADLASIEEILSGFTIQVQRKKSIGISVKAPESERRQILSGVINSELNEYDFFEFLKRLEKEQLLDTLDNYFMKYIDNESLYIANHAIQSIQKRFFEKVTDSQLQQLIILLAISIHRLKLGKEITDIQYSIKETDIHQPIEIASELFADIEKLIEVNVTDHEIYFLALQIRGMNGHIQRDIFLENYDVELSFKIKELIHLVSTRIEWDFSHDTTLFYDLMAHLSAALKRSVAPIPQMNNPLLEKIKIKYTELYQILEESLTSVFPETVFLLNEVAYIVIHFASTYEKKSKTKKLSVLVICSSGIGSAKILENRLKKNIPEINEVLISRIAQLDSLELGSFDLILSTIFLSGFRAEYKVITPLLLEEEIRDIQLYIKSNYTSTTFLTKDTRQQINTTNNQIESFQEVYKGMKVANQILENFDIKAVRYSQTLESTINEICQSLEGLILTDAKVVAAKLMGRLKQAPIGIPETNLALFHCISSEIKFSYFSIYEIKEPLSIIGMDRTSIKMKRILLLLGPEPLSDYDQKVLGEISASIIESNLNMELYNSGARDEIYRLLSKLFLIELTKYN